MDRESGDLQAMIAENEKAIRSGMTRIMKESGYRKKKNSWYLEKDEVVLVANLQHSSWGKQFYINLAAMIKALDANKEPPEYKCHIRERLSFGKEPEPLLDAEDITLSPLQHEQLVYERMRGHGIPLLLSWQSLENIFKQALEDEKLWDLMTVVARTWLKERFASRTESASPSDPPPQ